MRETENQSEENASFRFPEEGGVAKARKKELSPEQDARSAALKEQAGPIEDEIAEIEKVLGKTEGLTGRSHELSIRDNLTKDQIRKLKTRLKILKTQLAPLRKEFLPLDRLSPKFGETEWEQYNSENNTYEKNKLRTPSGQRVEPGFNAEAFRANQEAFKIEAQRQNTKRQTKNPEAAYRLGPITSKDVAQDEALKDNTEFDLKKRSREFNENQEKLELVKRAMDTKRDLILEGKRKLDDAKTQSDPEVRRQLTEEGQRMIEEAGKKRIVLILPGGGLKVSHSFAQIDALYDMGYGSIQIDEKHSIPVINDLYGISTGTMAAGAFMSGHKRAREIGAMFFKEHLDPRFINFSASRILGHFLGKTPMVNLGFVEDLLKQDGTGKSFDKQAILDYPGDLWDQITWAEDIKDETGKVIHEAGTAELVNVKEWIRKGGDPARIAKMSMNVPFFDGPDEIYEGKKVTDGDVAKMKMDEVIKNSKPDYVIVMPQVSFKENSNSLKTKIKNKLFNLTPIGDIKKRGFLVKGLVKTGAYEDLAKKFSTESNIPTAISYAPESDADTLNKDADPVRMRYNTYRNTCIAWGRPDLVEGYSVKENSKQAIQEADEEIAAAA